MAAVRRAIGGGARIGRAKPDAAGNGGFDIDDHVRLAAREDAAQALGQAGRRLREAVAALQAADRAARSGDPADRGIDAGRAALGDRAAQALWEFVVQRESVGITDHRLLDQVYGVTPELWRRMGAAPSPSHRAG